MGGSQYQAKMLLEYLAAKDSYDIYYLARLVSDQSSSQDYCLRRIAVPVGVRKYGEFMDTFDLLKMLKEISPDIIYQRVGCAYTGITAFYAKNNNKRCVWHVAHDMEVIPFDRRFTRNIVFRFINKKFLEYGLRNASEVITQTQQQADYLHQYYNRKAGAVIPNYHPFPSEKIKKNEVITIVWIANLKPWKRPELFIRLAKEFLKIENVEFIMIGKPMGSVEWCDEICRQSSQVKNLRYLGEKSQDYVNRTLSGAHIFVNTSEQEGFANTFIQSWLRKVPVVSLSVNPDGVFDKHLVGFHAGNFDNLIKCVHDLVVNENLRNSLGEYAQRYAKENYSQRNLEKLARITLNEG